MNLGERSSDEKSLAAHELQYTNKSVAVGHFEELELLNSAQPLLKAGLIFVGNNAERVCGAETRGDIA